MGMVNQMFEIVELLQALPMLVGDEESGGEAWLLLSGPLAGGALYGALYRFYRNTDKSHRFEKETAIESQPVAGGENKIEELRGIKRGSIQGNNVRNYRQRVQRVQ